jgi:sugar/nucleoside kinase (ribokinase family)
LPSVLEASHFVSGSAPRTVSAAFALFVRARFGVMSAAQSPKPPAPPATLAELIAKQGVKPVVDVEAVSALWPVDDDPERMDAFILEQRESRRASAR